MGNDFRGVKIAAIVMGVLIVVGTIGLAIGVVRKASAPSVPVAAALPSVVDVVLQEPEGTRIAAIAVLADRLAVQLQGGGVDRVVLVDPKTGALAGRVSLAH
ncbi:MAG: hypothetical protein U1E70_05635 [Acetobacteraceae bacterium]